MSRILFAAFTLGFGVSALAQPPAKPDPIAQAQVARDLADQKAEAQVNDAIKEADKVAKVSALRAIQQLKQEQLGLDLSVVVSSGKRAELTKTLQAKIDALKGVPATPADDVARADAKAAQDKAVAAMRKEVKEVNEEVAEVAKLVAAGRTREAEVRAAALAAKYPDNPAAINLTYKGTMSDNVAVAKAMTKEFESRVLYAFNDVTRSAMPAKGDIEFPKDWNEKTKRRLKTEELSPEMRSLVEALDKPVNVPVVGQSLGEAIQSLSNAIDKPIAVEEKSLDDLGIDLKKPVTFNPGNKPLTARTVLRGLLQSQQLTFVVKDNLIQVVTLEKARTMLVTKAYYLGDIVQGIGPLNGGAIRWGPFLDYQQTMQNVNVLIEAIKLQVDPYVWKGEGGGPGSITFHFPSMSMIVRAPAEVHATLANTFKQGK
jgi:hypothetical protein